MKTFYVRYETSASFVIKVEADTAESARELADEAYGEQAPGSLCWSCARDYDLGEFEQDDSDGGVWEA